MNSFRRPHSTSRPRSLRDVSSRCKTGKHVHDLQATILQCLGIDHKRLTFKFQGRHFRLTDVHGEIVKPILG